MPGLMDAGEDKEQGEDHQVAESQTTVGEDGALHDGKIALVTREVAAVMAMWRPDNSFVSVGKSSAV